MAKTFAITTTATDTLKTDSKGHAEAVYTVTNTSTRPVRGMVRAKALESAKQEWLQVTGETERDFAPGATQQFVVTFDAPAATAAAADQYSFRLDVSSATNPDEDFTEGPPVKVQLPAPVVAASPSKPFPKWIFIPIAAVILIGIAVGLFFALRKTDIAVPNVVGKTLADATTELESAKLVAVEKEVQITGQHPVGEVIDQDPKPDSSPVPKGTTVNLITEGEVPLVDVPDVTKRVKDDATARLKEAGFSVVEKGTEVAEGLQPNQVVSQKPAGGEKAKQGDTVELTVATQKLITVPEVVFKPSDIAQKQITAAGLTVVMKEPELADPSVAPGNIKKQNPTAGSSVPPGAVIELTAAAQPTTVPYLSGKTLAEAQFLLHQAGLDVGDIAGFVTESNANTVQVNHQNPAYNTKVARGSQVDLTFPQLCLVRPCRIVILPRKESQRMMMQIPRPKISTN